MNSELFLLRIFVTKHLISVGADSISARFKLAFYPNISAGDSFLSHAIKGVYTINERTFFHGLSFGKRSYFYSFRLFGFCGFFV